MTDVAEEIRFCPNCGHEGHDITCPVCHSPMESLESEIDRVAKIEDDKKDIFADVSLELEQDKENQEKDESEDL